MNRVIGRQTPTRGEKWSKEKLVGKQKNREIFKNGREKKGRKTET